MEGANIF